MGLRPAAGSDERGLVQVGIQVLVEQGSHTAVDTQKDSLAGPLRRLVVERRDLPARLGLHHKVDMRPSPHSFHTAIQGRSSIQPENFKK